MPKIKIHYFSPDAPRLQLTKTGDWIDLYCAQDMTLHAGEFALVPLGVSMQLPEGYEARTAPRSCTRSRRSRSTRPKQWTLSPTIRRANSTVNLKTNSRGR